MASPFSDGIDLQISISLKGTEANSFDMACRLIAMQINEQAEQMRFLAVSDRLSRSEKEDYFQLLERDMDQASLCLSLRTMSRLLQKHYDKKVIILVDEYDVPLAKADKQGYYKDMVLLIRGMFEQAFKTNPYLEFAVLTGCLRIAKESLFTGLNNLNVYTMADAECGRWFGFTDSEVLELLEYYGLSEYYEITKEWYDGYRIGNVRLYNPWDIVCWVRQLRSGTNTKPRNFRINTSSNEEVRQFIRRMDNGVAKSQIERLISGETVTRKIEQQLTYDTLYDSIDNMWSLLFSTGYLTQSGEAEGEILQLKIPNTEIRNIFLEFILHLFEDEVKKDGTTLDLICAALQKGDADEAERMFTLYLKKTVSIRDTFVKKEYKENFYHGFLLGILGFQEGWMVDSNRESGSGYSDIFIEIDSIQTGMIIEVKYAEDGSFDAECRKAMQQIEDMGYVERLKEDGMQTIFKYAISCYRKQCKVICERENLC